MSEAPLEDSGSGLRPTGEGWFVVTVVAVGARSEAHRIRYPVSELAATYGASVAEETSDPEQAYAGAEELRLRRPSSWNRLP